MACDRQGYWDNRANFLDYLRMNRYSGAFQRGILRKILPDGSKRDLNVVIEQGPEFAARNVDEWDEWSFTETIRFIAHDPIWFDPNEIVTLFPTTLEDELVFPFTIFGDDLTGNGLVFGTGVVNEVTTLYAGTWFSYPVIVIEGPASGL
jgi:hypothetical protein